MVYYLRILVVLCLMLSHSFQVPNIEEYESDLFLVWTRTERKKESQQNSAAVRVWKFNLTNWLIGLNWPFVTVCK